MSLTLQDNAWHFCNRNEIKNSKFSRTVLKLEWRLEIFFHKSIWTHETNQADPVYNMDEQPQYIVN